MLVMKRSQSSFDNFSEKICQVPIYLNGNSSDLIMENNYTVAFIEMLVLVTKNMLVANYLQELKKKMLNLSLVIFSVIYTTSN